LPSTIVAVIVVVMRRKDGHCGRGTQRRRIAALRRHARQLSGGTMKHSESRELSADNREQFWQHVVDFETAPSTTDFERLIEAGVDLPEPDGVKDDQLHDTLWNVITALADLRVFLDHTDHLSDRELYTSLWEDLLREEIPLLPDDNTGNWHVSVLGGWSEADTRLFLKYYADERWRKDWAKEFPELEIPPHEDPPYDRDRHLPTPYGNPPLH
jgi:hypothetical protein